MQFRADRTNGDSSLCLKRDHSQTFVLANWSSQTSRAHEFDVGIVVFAKALTADELRRAPGLVRDL